MSPHPEMCLVSQQYFYFSLNLESTLLGWPNGSGGSLQSCYIWVQFPSPALRLEHIDFLNYLRQNVREVTAKAYIDRLRRLSRIGNLDNTEQMKNLICTYQCTESYKELLSHAYDYWVKYNHLTWKKPHFVRERARYN